MTQRHEAAGYTLLELVVAMGSAGVLLVGLGSSVMLTAQAFRPQSTTQYMRTSASLVQRDVLGDLQLATAFLERTDRVVTFTVPDRDGDRKPETIRYAWSGIKGDPLTVSINSSAASIVLANVTDLNFNYVTRELPAAELPIENNATSVLLVVEDSQSLTAGEMELVSLIDSWNYAIVIAGLDEPSSDLLKKAKDASAIYLPASLNASRFSNIADVASLAVGIVNENKDLTDDIGFAGGVGTANDTRVSLVDNLHYITLGLTHSSQQVHSSIVTMTNLKSPLATDLNILANVNGEPALATVDAGEELQGGSKAAARRVQLPWGGSRTFNYTSLNTTGMDLTRKALEWALGKGSDSNRKFFFGFQQLFSSTASGGISQQHATKVTLGEKANLLAISAFTSGLTGNVRFAIYSDKTGQPDKLLAQTEVAKNTFAGDWATMPVTPIALDPGTYWLALSEDGLFPSYRIDSSVANAGRRTASNAAVTKGFLNNWGSSTNTANGAISIYGIYEAVK